MPYPPAPTPSARYHTLFALLSAQSPTANYGINKLFSPCLVGQAIFMAKKQSFEVPPKLASNPLVDWCYTRGHVGDSRKPNQIFETAAFALPVLGFKNPSTSREQSFLGSHDC